MNISIVTVFSQLYKPFLETSLVHRAQKNNLITCDVENLFSYVSPKERIDAPTFGPNSGMLIRPHVVECVVNAKERQHGKAFKVFFSPQGKKLDQRLLLHIATCAQQVGHLMLFPARYEGMDARVEEYYADSIVSVGDFVLMGGDIPAMMLLEGVLRLIPGVVGKAESVQRESFSGPFVDYPEYTEPVVWKDISVPNIIRSGNHKAIEEWRYEQAAHKTVRHHFLWLRSYQMTQQEKERARKHIPSHYIALLHTDVVVGGDRKEGVTSVTSVDIHDIARSASTYGMKNFFVVTPLRDQQQIVNKFLHFWRVGYGCEYNKQRSKVLDCVEVCTQLDEVIAFIEEKEGIPPLLIATSAHVYKHMQSISFFDQERVWALDRPVLFILGTGQGLSEACIDRCDFLLIPIEGFTDFNHLSVRSAAAIILDRWLGISQKIGI